MSLVARNKILFLLADELNRCYYYENGSVGKSSIPRWLKRNPDGWREMTLQFATNEKYFSTIRQFSSPVQFVQDGQAIIADRMINGNGTEEVMYLIILENNPAKGLNYYELVYKSRLDFSRFDGDFRKGVSINTLQDDVFALVQANETNVYSIQCNASNPAAVKILFDGILLQDKANYEPVDVLIYSTYGVGYIALPISFINNEGDSIGVVQQSQDLNNNINGVNSTALNTYIGDPTNANFLIQFQSATRVHIKGTVSFIMRLLDPSSPLIRIDLFFIKSSQTSPYTLYNVPASQIIFSQYGSGASWQNNGTYKVNVDIYIDMAANEKLFFFAYTVDIASPVGQKIEFLSNTLSLIYSTKQVPSIAYGIRPLDFLQQLVSKITNGKYTADSNFFRNNNRKVLTSGSALRSFNDAVIQTTFSNFFRAFSSCYNLGITVRNGVLWIEPIGDLYNSTNELMNLGEVSKASLKYAEKYIYTAAKTGYTKQVYNKRNGRYEFNCVHNYKFPIDTVLNMLDLTSPIRSDSFGAEFIRTGYPELNSTDDKGDSEVFAIMISDSIGQTDGQVSNALTVNVVTLILAPPVIKTPFTGQTIYNTNPTVTGIAQPSKIITIYVDGFIDGTTNSDGNGNWSYEIQTSLRSLSLYFNGVHIIEANAQTDPSNISDFSNKLTIVVNTQVDSSFLFTTPTNNDVLYNNLPFISGIAPAGKVITLKLDGTTIATVTTNTSGIWSYQITSAISDGLHVFTASAPGLPDAPTLNVTINKNVSTPLITLIQGNDTFYNQNIFNNLPLIKGVAIPGTTVSIYLDGGGGTITTDSFGNVTFAPLGTAVADANGDWQFQVGSYIDPITGLTQLNIPDGAHVFSTTSTPINVIAEISGYRLMRGSNKGPVMDYDSIRLDDSYINPDTDPASLAPTLGQFLHPETLYNIEETTPLRQLLAHANILSPFVFQQLGKKILFQSAEINANLVTSKNGVILNEGQSIAIENLDKPLFYPWILDFTTEVPKTFNEIMTGVNNSGYISLLFRGVAIYVLPLGSMEVKIGTNQAQQWKLLISAKTPLSNLLGLFKNGLSINLSKNMIYVSNKNPLHFVAYNKTLPAKYHFADIYDDWQKNRNANYVSNLDFAQPWQSADPMPLQFITNAVSGLQLQIFSVFTGNLVNTINVTSVVSPVQLPNVLMQVNIDWSNTTTYPEGKYWCALFADGALVAIAEKVWLKADWPGSVLLEYDGSSDDIDYYFSTGIKSAVRVFGKLYNWKPESEMDSYEDEIGDFAVTRALPLKKRDFQIGNEFGLIPDWMALKLNEILMLDNLRIEGEGYTSNGDSQLEKIDDGVGSALSRYRKEMVLSENTKGNSFQTSGDTTPHTTLYALDATAFGRNEGVINVTANEN